MIYSDSEIEENITRRYKDEGDWEDIEIPENHNIVGLYGTISHGFAITSFGLIVAPNSDFPQ